MTTFTGPLVVASAGTQGDGTSVAKVSVNGQIETDAGMAVAGALSAASLGITGAGTITGTGTIGGHTLAASALTVVLGTNAEASAGNGGAVPATAAGFFEITVDATAALVPYFKVPT